MSGREPDGLGEAVPAGDGRCVGAREHYKELSRLVHRPADANSPTNQVRGRNLQNVRHRVVSGALAGDSPEYESSNQVQCEEVESAACISKENLIHSTFYTSPMIFTQGN